MTRLPHRKGLFPRHRTILLVAVGLAGWASAALGQVINIPFRDSDARLCGLCIPESLTTQLNCSLRVCAGAEGGCSFFVVGNPDGTVRILTFCEPTLI